MSAATSRDVIADLIVEAVLEVAQDEAIGLTVVEFDNSATVSLRLIERANIKERVVCGLQPGAAQAGARGLSAWTPSCRTAAQLHTLYRALLKANSRVAIVASRELSAAQVLRCIQLYLALPLACLIAVATSPPPKDKQLQKMIFALSRDHRICERQLPKESESRSQAWRLFLESALQLDTQSDDCGHVARRPSSTRWQELLQRCSKHNLLVTQDENHGAAQRRPASAEEDVQVSAADSSTRFPPVMLNVTDQLAELRAEVDQAVRRMEPTVLDNGVEVRTATASEHSGRGKLRC